MRYRVEKDSLGYKKVPSERYFGIHTERSKETFDAGGRSIDLSLFLYIAMIKIATAKANMELGFLDRRKGNAIVKAAKEVVHGKFNDEFVIDVFQAGAGTSTHMNVNEVIANRAIKILGGHKGDYEIVHPNDDVNMGQSTNNVFPSAIKISCYVKLGQLVDNLKNLRRELKNKSREFRQVVKSGRTHLQDAVPITVGQEFHAYASMIDKDIIRIKEVLRFLVKLNVGRNAIGTGINTHPSFNKKILKHLKKLTRVNWREARDPIEATQSVSDFLEVSEVLKLLVMDLGKICNDFRLLSSGPVTGLREIKLPSVEPGSSIMPGKMNPSIPEMMNMICFKVLGNNESISYSVQAGQLELNVMTPLIAQDLLESLNILNKGLKIFVKKCVIGIKVNKEVCRYYFEHSVGLATLLNPYIGYDKASWVVKESLRSGKSIKEIVVRKKWMKKEDLDRILDYRRVTGPNLRR